MNSENLGRLFARYTFPTVLAMLVSSTYQIADGIIIGHYIGTDGLAAISLVWPWFSVPLGFGLMVGMGIGSVSSVARGAGRTREANHCIGQLFIWLLLPGLLLGALLYLLAPTLIQWQGASGLSAQYSIDYLRVIALSCPLVIASMAAPFLVRNLNAPRLATLFMICGALLNIALAYLFTAHFQWHMRGVALSTVIAETVAALLAICYIFSKRSQVRLRPTDYLPDWQLTKKIGLNGSSSLFMYSYLGAIALLHQIMLLKYGNTEWIAAYAIVGYILTVYYLIAEGIANGMQPIASRLYGAREYSAVRRLLSMALWWGVGLGLLLTLVMQLAPHFFVTIFTDADASLNEKAVYAIRVNLFVMFLDGLFVISAAFFQALNQGRLALNITLGNMLSQVPCLLILPLLMDIYGVWLAMPLSNILLMFYVIWLLRKQLRKLPQQSENHSRLSTA